jgi:hypothetical protein
MDARPDSRWGIAVCYSEHMKAQSKSTTPRKKDQKTNPFISLLILIALVGPIAGVVVLLEVLSSVDSFDWGFVGEFATEGGNTGVLFAIIGLVPIMWSLMMFIALLFVKKDAKKGLAFLAFCMLATGIGLIIDGIIVGALAYGLVQLVPKLETLWIIGSIALGGYLAVKAGPIVAKALFVRDKNGRFIIDNSYLFGGTKMPSKKVRQKRGF